MPLHFKRILAAAAVFSAGLQPALAQEPGVLLRLFSQCRADAAEFCDDVRPGGGRIAACLYAHMDHLRPGCRQAVGTGLAIKACAFDAKEFCDGVPPGGGRIAACLAEVRERLSPDCGAVIALWRGPAGDWRDEDESELLK